MRRSGVRSSPAPPAFAAPPLRLASHPSPKAARRSFSEGGLFADFRTCFRAPRFLVLLCFGSVRPGGGVTCGFSRFRRHRSRATLARDGGAWCGMTTAAGGSDVFETIKRAVGLHQAGRLDEAAALYNSVLAANPDHVDALYFLGMVAAQRSQFTESERLIGRMLTLNTQNADAYSNYAGVLNALKRPQEALASLDRAVALNPSMPAAHANRGITLHTLKRYEEAVAAYDKAL